MNSLSVSSSCNESEHLIFELNESGFLAGGRNSIVCIKIFVWGASNLHAFIFLSNLARLLQKDSIIQSEESHVGYAITFCITWHAITVGLRFVSISVLY